LRQGGIDVSFAQLTRDAGQASAEDEDLGVLQPLAQRMDEAQQEAGVSIHRARDVADDDERAGADLSASGGVARAACRRGAGSRAGWRGVDELAVFRARTRAVVLRVPSRQVKPSMMRALGDLFLRTLEKSLRRSISRELKSMTSSGEASKLLLGGGDLLSLADVEDVLLISAPRACAAAPSSSCWRQAAAARRGVLGNEGIEGSRFGAEQLRQKRENSRSKTGICSGG
jgi:hypothetical protein